MMVDSTGVVLILCVEGRDQRKPFLPYVSTFDRDLCPPISLPRGLVGRGANSTALPTCRLLKHPPHVCPRS